MPKVFTSYSHDSQSHKDRTLALSNRLRTEGVECHIDQYETSPREGWPIWMINQIGEAEYVLVICTEKYFERFMGRDSSSGKGSTWEGAIITQEMYDSFCKNLKFVPVVFCRDDEQFIPMPLRSATRYCLESEEGYLELYRRLTNQGSVIKPALGEVRTLPPSGSARDSSKELAEEAAEAVAELPSSSSTVDDPMNVLLSSEDGSAIIARADRITSEDKLTVTLSGVSARDESVLEEIKRKRPEIGVAFSLSGLQGRVLSASSTLESGKLLWTVEISPSNKHHSGLGEMACGKFSADDIAELRARRILLDEKPPDYIQSDDSTTLMLNNAMLEAFIQGIGSSVKIEKSIIPLLYGAAGENAEDFLVAAKLFSVLLLNTSGVVEHIYKLDMKLENKTKLSIDFEGRRPRVYSNVEPPVIQVQGVCDLVSRTS
jgi:hypothetical protein